MNWLIILYFCSGIFCIFLHMCFAHEEKLLNNKLANIRYNSYNQTFFEQYKNDHPQLTFQAVSMIKSQLAEYFCANYLSGKYLSGKKKFSNKFTLAMPSKIVYEYWQVLIYFDPTAYYLSGKYLSGKKKSSNKFTLAMPSKIVYEYWQALIYFDPIAYMNFCMENLGFYLALDDGIAVQNYQKDFLISDRLNRTWLALRNMEKFDNNDDRNRFMPQLFLIDEEFKISDGYRYNIAEFQKYNFIEEDNG